MCIVTFSTYVLISDENILTPTKAFVALVLFDIMKMPLALLPLLVVYVVEVMIQNVPNVPRVKVSHNTYVDRWNLLTGFSDILN